MSIYFIAFIVQLTYESGIIIEGGLLMKKFVCTICGYIYDESLGNPDHDVAAGTKWENVPEDWVCPICTAPKAMFNEIREESNTEQKEVETRNKLELSALEMSILCSNLAKGCEKQVLTEEMQLFLKLADYFKAHADKADNPKVADMLKAIKENLTDLFPDTSTMAKELKDRGSLRALVWSEKVSKMQNSLLDRILKEGTGFIEKTNVFVCEICVYIYVGDDSPEICPVCKVPSFKLHKIERGQ